MLDRSGRVMPRSHCHTEPICHPATGHPARCVPSTKYFNTFIEYSKKFWHLVQHVVYQVLVPPWNILKAVCHIFYLFLQLATDVRFLLVRCSSGVLQSHGGVFMVKVVVYSDVLQMVGANQTLYCAWAVSLSLVVKGKSSVRRGITRDKHACLQNFLLAKASFAFTSVSHCQLSCQCFISIFPSM